MKELVGGDDGIENGWFGCWGSILAPVSDVAEVRAWMMMMMMMIGVSKFVITENINCILISESYNTVYKMNVISNCTVTNNTISRNSV